jgi:hypothetical protein
MSAHVLPPFPTDEFTLTQLEHALDTSVEVLADGSYKPVGGEFTLSKFLDFMSGYDPERSTFVGYTSGVCGEGDPAGAIPIYESWDQHYTERCVIRALINRVRELEAS